MRILAPVNLTPVRNADDQYGNPLILDAGYDAVVADPPSPKSAKLAGESRTERPRVVEHGNARFERRDDPRGLGPSEFLQFLRRGWEELNRPGQARPSSPLG